MRSDLAQYDARYRRLRAGGYLGWAGERQAEAAAQAANSFASSRVRGLVPPPPARVLELGCGNAWSTLALAKAGYGVGGIDISEVAVEWARDIFADAGESGSVRHGDVRDMSCYATGSWDLVLDGKCLHCLIGDDRGICLREVHRLLVGGGTFVVSTMCDAPKSQDAIASFDAVSKCLVADGRPYRTLLPLADLCAELQEAAFEIVETDVAVNAWWNHASIVCRTPKTVVEAPRR